MLTRGYMNQFKGAALNRNMQKKYFDCRTGTVEFAILHIGCFSTGLFGSVGVKAKSQLLLCVEIDMRQAGALSYEKN